MYTRDHAQRQPSVDSFDLQLLQAIDGFKNFSVVPTAYYKPNETPKPGFFGFDRKYQIIVRVILVGQYIEAYGLYGGRILHIKRLMDTINEKNRIIPVKNHTLYTNPSAPFTHYVHVNHLGETYMVKHKSQYAAERHAAAVRMFHGTTVSTDVLQIVKLGLNNG